MSYSETKPSDLAFACGPMGFRIAVLVSARVSSFGKIPVAAAAREDDREMGAPGVDGESVDMREESCVGLRGVAEEELLGRSNAAFARWRSKNAAYFLTSRLYRRVSRWRSRDMPWRAWLATSLIHT